jgi:hypothetical protein
MESLWWLTTQDVVNMRNRKAALDCRTEAVKLRELLRTQGRFKIFYHQEEIRFVMFVPECILNVCDVVIADAKHQLNNGGYVL